MGHCLDCLSVVVYSRYFEGQAVGVGVLGVDRLKLLDAEEDLYVSLEHRLVEVCIIT